MKIEKLIKRQNLILGFLIFFIGLIVVKNTHQNQNKKIASLKDQIRQLEEKENILKEIQILEKKIERYKERFTKKDVSSLIEELTRNAGICNLKVSSIRPEPEKLKENFVWQPITMELTGGYHNLGRFLALLEKNPQIKIEEIRTSKIVGEEKGEDLRSNLSISSISLK